jgi:hypothetical protein
MAPHRPCGRVQIATASRNTVQDLLTDQKVEVEKESQVLRTGEKELPVCGR